MSIKASLLKWAHHINKGTTWGYASTKDCLVAFGFLLLLIIALSYSFTAICGILRSSDFVRSRDFVFLKYDIYLSSVVFLLTIIASYSMILMRINDIFGRRYFTRKRSIFIFFTTVFFIEVFFNATLKKLFHIQSPISIMMIIYAIICIYPASSKEREEMPLVEYKLPTEFIIFLSIIIAAVFVLFLFKAILTPNSENGIIYTYDKVYKTVKIGKQTWMAENLNYGGEGGLGKCYDDDPSNCEIYGRLYDWETAMKICPKGWHLPKNSEWEILYEYIGGFKYIDIKSEAKKESANEGLKNAEISIIEDKLKAKKLWNTEAADLYGYGFEAPPGGIRLCNIENADCVDGEFKRLGISGFWWTATKNFSDYPEYRTMPHKRSIGEYSDKHLMSVRCVED